MEPEARRPKSEIPAEFEKMLPGILGELYAIVAHALGNTGRIGPPHEIRMADAATWLVAAEGRADLFEYIEVFYNRKRRHGYLGNVSPVDFESNGSF